MRSPAPLALALVAQAATAAACDGDGGVPAGTCARLEATYTRCTEAPTAPAKRAFHDFCRIAASYRAAPGDSPDNLAATAKAAAVECASQTTCETFSACMARHNCRFQLANTADGTPTFACW